MKTYGLDRFGELIARQCAMAHALGERIAATPSLELLAPVALNIVCFRYVPPHPAGELDEISERVTDELNARLLIELQERGLAVPSSTHVDGKFALRMNVMNHRTTQVDLDAALSAVLAVGKELADSQK